VILRAKLSEYQDAYEVKMWNAAGNYHEGVEAIHITDADSILFHHEGHHYMVSRGFLKHVLEATEEQS
jgi:hypothetical protein